MSLQLISFARYLTVPGVQWTQPYYSANKLVKAVKGQEVRGFANLNLAGIPFTLNRNSAPQAIPYMAQVIVKELRQLLSTPHYVVPIPHSACTLSSSESPKLCTLANLIASSNAASTVWDGLRWDDELQKSSQGGTRNYQIILDNYQAIHSLPQSRRVILLDDVATTGNHLLAAANFLKQSFKSVCDVAIVVGRTVHNTSHAALGSLTESL